MKNNNFIKFAVVTALLLLIPLILNFPWSLFDFIVMGILLFGTGVAYELITRKVGKDRRIIVAVVLLIAFLLIWGELAVGIFGTPFAGS